jgi:hypothetical protein
LGKADIDLAKIRVKSEWFKDGAAKTPQQNASAIAFITWRVTQNMLKQMRSADFTIEVGPQYFEFTREVLVFLTQVLDRIAFARMEPAVRLEFVTALVRRLAEVLQENEDTLLGIPAAGEPSHFDQFIDLFNALAGHYADFSYSEQGPDFAFTRYLGHRIEHLMPEKDKRWVLDQIMATEVPQAVETVQRAMQGLLSAEPRSVRSSRTVSAGD